MKKGVVKIKGFDYYISENGFVCSSKGKLLAPYLNSKGYHRVSLYKNGNRYQRFIHTLQIESRLERPPLKDQVNHKDLNKTNNHYLNLEYCDNKENAEHRAFHQLLNRV